MLSERLVAVSSSYGMIAVKLNMFLKIWSLFKAHSTRVIRPARDKSDPLNLCYERRSCTLGFKETITLF